MVPDATCDYAFTGVINGKDYFRRLDGSYFIWWSVGDTAWIISAVLDVKGASWWERVDPDIVGAYTNAGTATGVATVQLGTHL